MSKMPTNIPPLQTRTLKKATAKDARQAVLSGSMPIIRELLRTATGELFDENDPSKGYTSYDKKSRDMVVDIIRPMIQAAGEVQQLNAKSSQDIIGLISSGKCSIEEALNLMRLVQMEFEMTELRSLADKLDQAQEPNASEGKYSHG